MIYTNINLLLMFVFSMVTVNVNAGMNSLYSVNYGVGQSVVNGDYTQSYSSDVVGLEIDYDGEDYLFEFGGVTSTNNEFKNMKLLVGYGNKYFKVGSGFYGIQSSIPTKEYSLHLLLRTDPSEQTEVSTSTIPLYVRFSPYKSGTFSIELDAYYGLKSWGSMTIPVQTIIPGKTAYVTTEPVSAGGTKGGSLSLTYRINNGVGLRLSYWVEQGQMDKEKTRIANEPLGFVGPVETPNLWIKNEMLYLSLVLLTD